MVSLNVVDFGFSEDKQFIQLAIEVFQKIKDAIL
jgi:hypothetical protein